MKRIIYILLAVLAIAGCQKLQHPEKDSSTKLNSLKCFVYADADNLRNYLEVDVLNGGTYSEESLRCRTSLLDYRRHLEDLPLGDNFTFLMGHGLLRAAVMGYADRKATPEELAKMQQLLRQCMEEGAMGLSFGLRYPPGGYADTDELIALAQVVAEYGGVITAHVRGEADTLIEATHEMLQVVRATGVRYVHSHHKAMGGPMNWNKTASTISMMEQAMNEGFDIFCDQYPYIASSNGLKSNIRRNRMRWDSPK
jgi:N-acyl-D-aspartate/D-glutamate deacylase